MGHLKRNTLATFAIVVSRVHLPPGWPKMWWLTDGIQHGNQRKLQKKYPRFFSATIHAPADSFISINEGMNEGPCRSFRSTLCKDKSGWQLSASWARRRCERKQPVLGWVGCVVWH